MLLGQGTGRWSRVAACLAVACGLGLATGARAEAGFITGLDGDGLYTADDPAEAGRWFDATTELNAGMVRLDLGWSGVVSGKPANPTDPSDPAYDFEVFDRAVQDAAARNLEVLMVLSSAPDWAQEAGGAGARGGAWKPIPGDLGEFARAVATRYSGSFSPASGGLLAGGSALPRVRYYEAWNEANLDAYLDPQYEGGKPVAADRYRRMVNAVDSGISAVDPSNEVVVGSLAPYGDEPGGDRTRPLAFLRELLCLNGKLKPTACPTKTQADIWSHHPINLSGGPRRSAIDPDDASSADLGQVRKVFRAAERAGTVAGGRKRHPLWVTEYWWESYPDGPHAAIPGLRKHGRWIEEAMYLYWKAGAKVVLYYSLVDSRFFPGQASDTLQAGLYLSDGTPKPAATAFRFPFVTERKRGSSVRAWGKAPAAGKLLIERKAKGGWRKVDTERVGAGQVFTANLRVRGKATLRARVGGDKSLPWTQRRG